MKMVVEFHRFSIGKLTHKIFLWPKCWCTQLKFGQMGKNIWHVLVITSEYLSAKEVMKCVQNVSWFHCPQMDLKLV